MRVFAGSLLFAVTISALVYSCAHNPYAKTNKHYRKQAKNLAQSLRPVSNKLLLDSAIMPVYAVGTTNFDLRKPNFVIIHHTRKTPANKP